jgi:hypothetical protein
MCYKEHEKISETNFPLKRSLLQPHCFTFCDIFMFSSLTALIERQIPDSFAVHSEEYRKARLGLTIALITFLAGVLYAPTFFLIFSAPLIGGFVIVAALQALLTFPLFRATSSLNIIGHNLASIFFIVMSVLIITTGGIDSTSSFCWILNAPIVALLLCGKNAGKFWTAMVIATGTGILGAQWYGVTTANALR